MHIEVSLKLSAGKLNYEPVVGRRTFYASVTFGSRTYWVQRWAEPESSQGAKPFMYSRDKRMSWTAGRFG